MRDISFGSANMCSLPVMTTVPRRRRRRWTICNLGSDPWRRSSTITTLTLTSCGKCSSTASISRLTNSNRPIAGLTLILAFETLMILVIASCGLPFSKLWWMRPPVTIMVGRTNYESCIIIMAVTYCSHHHHVYNNCQQCNNNPISPIRHGGHYSDIPSHMPSSPLLPTTTTTLYNKKYIKYNPPLWILSQFSWVYPVLIMSRDIPC